MSLRTNELFLLLEIVYCRRSLIGASQNKIEDDGE